MTYYKTGELGEFITLKRGYDLPQQNRKNGCVPIFSSSGISGTHDAAMVKAPGVITGRYGTIGQVFMANEDFWPLNTTLYVEDFHGNNPRFIYYFLKTLEWEKFTSASAVPGINRNTVHKEVISLPDIETQDKIASVLKTLDDKIEINQKINDNLANTEQAILVEAIRKNQTAPTVLGDLVDFIDGDRGKNYPTFEEFASTGYCLFLNASNVTSTGFNFDTCMFVTEEKDKSMNKGHLSLYDIVLTSRGTLGNVALYDRHIRYENMRINSGMLIIRPKTNQLSPYFIYALLKSTYMKAAIERFRSGSAQPQLPIKDLQKISFEIPQSDAVLTDLDRQFLSIEESISINNKEIDNLKGLSAVLLAELSR